MSLFRSLAWIIVATLALTACGPGSDADTRSRDLPVAALEGLSDTAADRIRRAMEAAGSEPRQAQAVGEYAMILHAYQQLDAAEAAYELARALVEGPDPWALYHGVLLLDTDRPQAALQAFENAQAEPVATVYQARALLADGRPLEAEALLLQVLEASPGRIDALLELAAIRQQSGDFETAAEDYRKALAEEKELAEAHYGLAQALRGSGREAAALAEMELFERYRGREWRSQDDPRRAIAELAVSERRFVDEAKAKLAQADFDSAIASLEQARQINPENLSTLTNLIALYGRVGRLEGRPIDRAVGLTAGSIRLEEFAPQVEAPLERPDPVLEVLALRSVGRSGSHGPPELGCARELARLFGAVRLGGEIDALLRGRGVGASVRDGDQVAFRPLGGLRAVRL